MRGLVVVMMFLTGTFLLTVAYDLGQATTIGGAPSNNDHEEASRPAKSRRRRTTDAVVDDWFLPIDDESGCGRYDDDLTVLGDEDDDVFEGLFHAVDDDGGCKDDVFQTHHQGGESFMGDDLWSVSADDDLAERAGETVEVDTEMFDDLTARLVDAGADEITYDDLFSDFEVTREDGTVETDEHATRLVAELKAIFGHHDDDGDGDLDRAEAGAPLQQQGRIVGGTVAGERRYPYLVSLLNVKPTSSGNKVFHACGGALVAPDVVLTAAHCVSAATRYAQIGKFHMHTSRNRPNSVETRIVRDVSVHPGWHRPTFSNDLALLRLDSPTTKTGNIVRVGVDDDDRPVDGEPLRIMGWGKTSVGSRLSSYMRHVSVNYMTNEECASSNYGYGSVIKPTMMCANNGPADACQGDSGGPVVRRDQQRPENPRADVLVGVVSWGFGCSFARYPGVYARLDVPWIVKTICDPWGGLSPGSCAGPNRLYENAKDDEEKNEPASSPTSASSPSSSSSSRNEVCRDKTTLLQSENIRNLDCNKVADFYWILCFYHRDDCPETCCPDACDRDTGRCAKQQTGLRTEQQRQDRGRIREHRPIEDGS